MKKLIAIILVATTLLSIASIASAAVSFTLFVLRVKHSLIINSTSIIASRRFGSIPAATSSM